MAGKKGQVGHKTKTSFKKGNQCAAKRTVKKTARMGRPPKPKKPSTLQLIYSNIDSIIESGKPFKVLQKVIDGGLDPEASARMVELAAKYSMDVLDRRLPKDEEKARPITIIINSHVPFPGGKTPPQVVIQTGE